VNPRSLAHCPSLSNSLSLTYELRWAGDESISPYQLTQIYVFVVVARNLELPGLIVAPCTILLTVFWLNVAVTNSVVAWVSFLYRGHSQYQPKECFLH
jgi:hypothetical protein